MILTFERLDTQTFSVDGYAVFNKWRLVIREDPVIFPN